MRNILIGIVLALWLSTNPSLASETAQAQTISPGSVGEFTAVARSCQTFSWTTVTRAKGYELALFEVLSDGALGDALLEKRFPAGTSSWTPSADQCSEPGGRYAWVIRTLGQPDGKWSRPALYTVPLRPSNEELAKAMETLRRHFEWKSATEAAGGGTEDSRTRAAGRPSSEPPFGAVGQESLAVGSSAIRGELGDTTGTTYGVVGVSNSSDGAGVAADNSTGGTDLILGGSPPALLTQSGLSRDSGSELAFDIGNPSGGMTLTVNGAKVFTSGNDGPNSGLDADFLDGVDSSGFAPTSHDHDERYFVEGELSSSGGGATVHWDNLSAVPGGLDDGDDDTTYTPGSGLELSALEFSVAFGGTGTSSSAAHSDHSHPALQTDSENLSIPDSHDLQEIAPIVHDLSDGSLTVSSGSNLYITQLFATQDGASNIGELLLSTSSQTSTVFSGFSNVAVRGGANFQLSQPIMVGPGESVSKSASGSLAIAGFEAVATVTPITHSLSLGDCYTVSDGPLVILNVYAESGAELALDDGTAPSPIPVLEGPFNVTVETVDTLRWQHLEQPIVVPNGWRVCAPNGDLVFNGYLQ